MSETHLPSLTKPSQTLTFGFAGLGEQVSIDHRVQEPCPVLLSDVRDEPWVTLSMEANLGGETGLDEEIG